MISERQKQVDATIEDTDRLVTRAMSEGLSAEEAVNKHAHTTECYEAMLKKHGLSPVIPD